MMRLSELLESAGGWRVHDAEPGYYSYPKKKLLAYVEPRKPVARVEHAPTGTVWRLGPYASWEALAYYLIELGRQQHGKEERAA